MVTGLNSVQNSSGVSQVTLFDCPCNEQCGYSQHTD